MKADLFEVAVRTKNNGNIQVYRLKKSGQELSFMEVIDLWETNNEFVGFYISIFKNCGFGAYVWETPPVSTKSTNRAFEFVIIKTPVYWEEPDLLTFKSYFDSKNPNQGIVTFLNLGGDATLIVPSPVRHNANYSSMANFFSEAPIEQQEAIWKVTANELKRLISDKPIWTSVAGGGVAWLHIRLDSRPKYYRYTEYVHID